MKLIIIFFSFLIGVPALAAHPAKIVCLDNTGKNTVPEYEIFYLYPNLDIKSTDHGQLHVQATNSDGNKVVMVCAAGSKVEVRPYQKEKKN